MIAADAIEAKIESRQPALVPQESFSPNTQAFLGFIRAAAPIVVKRVAELLPEIRRRVLLLARWRIKHDLLAIAGFGFVEDAYTELMAWALRPQTDSQFALARQRAWLNSLGLPASRFSTLATPETQVRTQDGRPDLVVYFEDFIVIVEAKTGSAEHPTPSGRMQTVAYAEGVPNPHRLPVHIVFITPDGSSAANSAAHVTSFAEFALTMAGVCETASVHEDSRFAFATLITHFITWATPYHFHAGEIILRLAQWFETHADPEVEQIVKRMPDLLAFMELFGLE